MRTNNGEDENEDKTEDDNEMTMIWMLTVTMTTTIDNDDRCKSPDLLLFIPLLLVEFLSQFLNRFALIRPQLSKLRICLILHLQSHLPTKAFNHEIFFSLIKSEQLN